MRTTVDRLRTWDRRSQVHESADRNLSRAFVQLRTFADKLALSSEMVERAAYIYRKALEQRADTGKVDNRDDGGCALCRVQRQ